jgi:hypothetical protein
MKSIVNFKYIKIIKATYVALCDLGHTAKTQYRKIRNKYSQKRNFAGLSPNFHIYVSVRDLYILTIGLPILLQENVWTDPGNI